MTLKAGAHSPGGADFVTCGEAKPRLLPRPCSAMRWRSGVEQARPARRCWSGEGVGGCRVHWLSSAPRRRPCLWCRVLPQPCGQRCSRCPLCRSPRTGSTASVHRDQGQTTNNGQYKFNNRSQRTTAQFQRTTTGTWRWWDPDLGIYGGLLGSSLDGSFSEKALSSNYTRSTVPEY